MQDPERASGLHRLSMAPTLEALGRVYDSLSPALRADPEVKQARAQFEANLKEVSHADAHHPTA